MSSVVVPVEGFLASDLPLVGTGATATPNTAAWRFIKMLQDGGARTTFLVKEPSPSTALLWLSKEGFSGWQDLRCCPAGESWGAWKVKTALELATTGIGFYVDTDPEVLEELLGRVNCVLFTNRTETGTPVRDFVPWGTMLDRIEEQRTRAALSASYLED